MSPDKAPATTTTAPSSADLVQWFKEFDSGGSDQISSVFKEAAIQLKNGSHMTQGIAATASLIRLLRALLVSGVAPSKLCALIPRATTDSLTSVLPLHDALCDVLCVLDGHTQGADASLRPRLVALVRALVSGAGGTGAVLAADLLRERLDVDLQGESGLVRNAKAANTKMIRVKTRLFYKQNKFNLHREESEGYAKLLTELLNRHHSDSGRLFEIIKALIGCFSLDPNRVVDCILEAIENQPDRHELHIGVLRAFGMDSGNIAQVVGFKFSHYQQQYQQQSQQPQQLQQQQQQQQQPSETASTGGSTAAVGSCEAPDSLFKACALLIKHEIITVEQIYSLLSPGNETLVEQYREELAQARQWAKKAMSLTTEQIADAERAETAAMAAAVEAASQFDAAAAGNSSSMAGGPVGNGPSSMGGSAGGGGGGGGGGGSSNIGGAGTGGAGGPLPSSAATAGQMRATEKAEMLQSGAGADEQSASAALTAGRSCCQKLALLAALVQVGAWKQLTQVLDYIPGPFAMLNEKVHATVIQTLHYMIDPLYSKYSTLSALYRKKISSRQKISSEGAECKQVHNFADFQKDVIPLVCTLGPMLHKDPVLLGKLVRLCKAFTGKKPQERLEFSAPELELDILTLLEEALLPSLQLLPANCAVSEELWCVIKTYSYQQRYRLYSSWKQESPHPLLIRARAVTWRRTRHMMKRLTKETAKQCGRQLAKLAHCSPCLVLGYMLTQAQQWDNLIGPVVDSLKFLTSLSYDCLAFCMVEALSAQKKDRLQDDGVTVSSWLKSIASFCGAVFKKYNIDLTGLLSLLANKIKDQKFLDLLVLKEIVYKMSGIEAMEQPTPDQLEAMYGGETLRGEASYFTQVKNVRKSSLRLKEALVQLDLAVPLCLLMAQQKQYILYRIEDAHIKLLGKMYDLCQETLFQFGQFLLVNYSSSEHRLPPVGELLSRYTVTADVAFFLARPGLMENIDSRFQQMKREASGEVSKQVEARMYVDAVNYVLGPLSEAIKPNYPIKCWQDLSSELFVAFWTLSMGDVVTPVAGYEREVGKLRWQISALEDNKELAPAKKKKDKERCVALIERLQEEQRRQEEHVAHVMTRLRQDKDSWFISHTLKNDTITQFLQLCLFPRCRFSPIDAIYCAHFVHTLHKLKTSNFSTLICFDKIFCDITYTVASCTEAEAYRYGLFLGTLMGVMMRWHSDEKVFDQECSQYPGFVTRFKGAPSGGDSTGDNDVDYQNYRHVCHKWHYKLTKALVLCLESDNDVQLKNGLIVLTKLVPHFPKVANLYMALDKRVEKLKNEERENRKDVFSLASMYSGHLKLLKQHCVPEQDFHAVAKKAPPNTAQANSGGGAAASGGTASSGGVGAGVGGTVSTNNGTSQTAAKATSAKNNKEDVSGKASSGPGSGGGGGGGAAREEVPVSVKTSSRDGTKQQQQTLPPPTATTTSLAQSEGSPNGNIEEPIKKRRRGGNEDREEGELPRDNSGSGVAGGGGGGGGGSVAAGGREYKDYAASGKDNNAGRDSSGGGGGVGKEKDGAVLAGGGAAVMKEVGRDRDRVDRKRLRREDRDAAMLRNGAVIDGLPQGPPPPASKGGLLETPKRDSRARLLSPPDGGLHQQQQQQPPPLLDDIRTVKRHTKSRR